MLIRDRIYGSFDLKEAVILDLLKSKGLKRLKGVSQGGLPRDYSSIPTYSRFEHSVGVMLLLKKLHASLEEQVAGLLHDISHTAFSHIADIALSDTYLKGTEDYHEQIKEKFVGLTKIPSILEKHGFNKDIVSDTTKFNLLERHEPDLCADRIDYVLRESEDLLKVKELKDLVSDLVNFNGEIVFGNETNAYLFSVNFLKLQTNFWGNQELNRRHFVFADLIKEALRKKIIIEGDLLEKSEGEIIRLMRLKGNKKFQETLDLLKQGGKLAFIKGKRVRKKFRYADPKILVNGKLYRLSMINSGFKRLLSENERINKKGIIV